MSLLIEDKAVVLFQGDSITDADRYREDPDHLGTGYAMLAASWFQALYPEKGVRFLNRGISGNLTTDLQNRWQEDCLDLQPSWVSILIGVNDTWRRYDSNIVTPIAVYEASYRAILERTVQELHARLILAEPFVLPVFPDRVAWREDLDPRIHVVRKLAREFGALLIPFDGLFAQVSALREPAFWAADGVHPTQAGHALMAQAWLRAVKAM